MTIHFSVPNLVARLTDQWSERLVAWSLLALANTNTGCSVETSCHSPLPTLQGGWQAPGRPFDGPTVAIPVRTTSIDGTTLDKAIVSIATARVTFASNEAGASPQIGGARSVRRQVNSGVPSSTTTAGSAGFGASLDLDLFCKLRFAREAATAVHVESIADGGPSA